jgi:hypothetical protein
MKKILLLAFCFFSVFSCGVGTIEAVPENTKFSMQNNSSVQLLSVTWNGTNFGDIGLGGVSEREVSDGQGYVYFNASDGKQYRTNDLAIGEKYKHNKFPFVDGTLVRDIGNSNTIIPLGNILNAD